LATLGRTTYNIFAGFWPKQDPNNAIAKPFNEATKYVVSHEPSEPDWVNTKVVSGGIVKLRKFRSTEAQGIVVRPEPRMLRNGYGFRV
jgi:dihydrofolate reductase